MRPRAPRVKRNLLILLTFPAVCVRMARLQAGAGMKAGAWASWTGLKRFSSIRRRAEPFECYDY